MRASEIISLQETTPNRWKAKYEGNYGVYTVKITLDKKGDVSDFSCTCPSDGYPCKHIPIVRRAIAERMSQNQRPAGEKGSPQAVEELLKDVPLQELRDFIARQAKYNPDLTNAIRLEFTHKAATRHANPYSAVLRDILKETVFGYEDYYEEESLSVDGLDQWLEKAQAHVEQKSCREAVLICQACIEEFAEWRQSQSLDAELADNLDPAYETTPFEILAAAAISPDVDHKALYDYCLLEMNKGKYAETEMFGGFNDLLAVLAARVAPNDFIALQDSLLKKVADKSSYEAEEILQRKIDFYNTMQQPEKANEIVEKNIQIEHFRYEVAEKRVAEQQLAEAKQLVKEFTSKKQRTGRSYDPRWDELLLKIAQQENDTPSIRAIAFTFIDQFFNKKYFGIYKSTFSPEEWPEALEQLLQHYEKSSCDFSSSSSVADVLVAEGAAERLLQYIAKNPDVELIEQYHTAFAAAYPEKTLELFRKAVDEYAEKNIGRSHYEYVVALLRKIRKIKNGDKTAASMVSRYRTEYKNRRAMIEILSKL